MGKGVEYATAEALEALKAELKQQASQASKREKEAQQNTKKIEYNVNRLQEMQSAFDDQHSRVQAQESALKSMQEKQERLQQDFKKETEKVQELQKESEDLQKAVSGVESLANSNYEVLQDMQRQAREEHMEELRKAREDLQKHALEASKKDADEAKHEAKKEVEGAKKEVRGEMSEGLEKLQKNLTESMKQTFDALEKNMSETRKTLEAQCDAVMKETKRNHEELEKSLTERIDKLEEDTKERMEEQKNSEKRMREALEETLKSELKSLDSKLEQNVQDLLERQKKDAEDLQELGREAEARSAAILAEGRATASLLQGETLRLNSFCRGVSGMATRQVEWRLNEDTVKQLEKLQDRGHADDGDAQTGFFSPVFEAAGTNGLQLELRVHSNSKGDEDGGSGNQISLYLWAFAGLQLVFRLFLGNESVILRHSFDGKTPCGLKRMGSILEQKNIDGSLRMGIEIHESLVESVASAGSHTNPMAGSGEPQGPVDGTLSMQRYLNHRLLELMQSQGRAFLHQLHSKLDVMRSRAVRRVQWRLENGPLLFQTFSKDQSVRSTAFNAAGISGMQLVFYPQGAAGARPGFCSIFLSCPPGVTLRCWLWAGRWRREARPEPAEQPDLVGRVNFARFENIIDPVDEAVDLVLEIEEVQQISKATMSSQPLEDSSCAENSEMNRSGMTQSETSKQVGRIERSDTATTKMQHVSKKANDDTIQQLPSIWTTQGFHSFQDLENSTSKGKMPSLTPRVPQSGRGKRKGAGRQVESSRER